MEEVLCNDLKWNSCCLKDWSYRKRISPFHCRIKSLITWLLKETHWIFLLPKPQWQLFLKAIRWRVMFNIDEKRKQKEAGCGAGKGRNSISLVPLNRIAWTMETHSPCLGRSPRWRSGTIEENAHSFPNYSFVTAHVWKNIAECLARQQPEVFSIYNSTHPLTINNLYLFEGSLTKPCAHWAEH